MTPFSPLLKPSSLHSEGVESTNDHLRSQRVFSEGWCMCSHLLVWLRRKYLATNSCLSNGVIPSLFSSMTSLQFRCVSLGAWPNSPAFNQRTKKRVPAAKQLARCFPNHDALCAVFLFSFFLLLSCLVSWEWTMSHCHSDHLPPLWTKNTYQKETKGILLLVLGPRSTSQSTFLLMSDAHVLTQMNSPWPLLGSRGGKDPNPE